MEVFGVLAILILPAVAWWYAARLLYRAGSAWWKRHLVGMASWLLSLSGVFLVTGATGLFDGEPSAILAILGLLLLLLLGFCFHRISVLPIGSRPAQTSTGRKSRFSPLSTQQRKALNLKERKQPDSAAKIHSKTPGKHDQKEGVRSAQSRAIRTGWSVAEIEFTYQDSAGDITRRVVTVHSVTATHIKGECHNRHEERTFRVDRIIGDVVDRDTGELIKPVKWSRRMASERV